jgi:20S proteasome alpha/beta subunit
VTIAIGLLCKGGAVLAADSQETVQGYWKRRQIKVHGSTLGQTQDLSIAMAGAGRAGYVDALIEQLIRDAIPADGNWHKSVAAIRVSLVAFHRDHVAPYQTDPPEAPLVIAMQKGAHLPSLFVTDRSTMTEVGDNVAAVGIGAGHALAILNRVAPPAHTLSLEAAIALAVYAIHHTKNHVADCGMVTNLIGIVRGQTIYVPEEAIADLDARYDRFLETTEPRIVQILVGVRKVTGALGKELAASQRAIMKAAGERLIGSGIEIVTGTIPKDDE